MFDLGLDICFFFGGMATLAAGEWWWEIRKKMTNRKP